MSNQVSWTSPHSKAVLERVIISEFYAPSSMVNSIKDLAETKNTFHTEKGIQKMFDLGIP